MINPNKSLTVGLTMGFQAAQDGQVWPGPIYKQVHTPHILQQLFLRGGHDTLSNCLVVFVTW